LQADTNVLEENAPSGTEVSRARKWLLYRNVTRQSLTPQEGIKNGSHSWPMQNNKQKICPLEGTMLFSAKGGKWN
jgi:hypothetical protein